MGLTVYMPGHPGLDPEHRALVGRHHGAGPHAGVLVAQREREGQPDLRARREAGDDGVGQVRLLGRARLVGRARGVRVSGVRGEDEAVHQVRRRVLPARLISCRGGGLT